MGATHVASSRLLRLPRVILATFLVAVCPSLLVSGLLGAGVISAPALGIPIAALVSLALCRLCGHFWERCRASQDVLFGDLMLWGWARGQLIERRLASARSMFGLAQAPNRRKRVAHTAEQRMTLLHRLATDLETSDPYTHGHSRRVARYSFLIASQMGLAQSEVAKIRAAAALHDVGKVNTPIDILHKPGRLTDEEFAVVKRHPVDGAQMIALQVQDPQLESIVRHHHERLDGTGYPSGLQGQEIPLGARVIAVADTFDAITSERPYRDAKPHKAALDILRAEAGTQLDRDVVRAFERVYFGRRPVAAVAVLTAAADRVLGGLLATGVSTAGLAGLAAATAGLGGAALLPSNSLDRSAPALIAGALPPGGRTAGALTPSGRTAALGPGGALTRVDASRRCCRLAVAGGRSRQPASGRPAPAGKSSPPVMKSGASPSGAPGAAGPGGNGSGTAGKPGPPAKGGVTATVRPPVPGTPTVSATLNPPNRGLPGVAATVNPGSAVVPSPSASVLPRAPALPSGVQLSNR
jgi:putative nucleotidyltransferase with HDIG domain